MKKCIIVINAYADKGGTRQTARLVEEFSRLGISAEVRTNDRFPLIISDSEIKLKDFECDFCVYLDKDKYVAAMLEKCGVKLFNSAAAIEVCDDKMLTHIALAGSGIPMPETIPGLLCYDRDAAIPPEVIDAVESRLGYPVVIKQSYGSIGKGVFKADSRAELIDICNKVKLDPHLFQQFVKSSSGQDMRVIVIGGKAIGAIKRISRTDFRSNIGLGAKAEKAELPDNVKYFAERAADVLGLDYCGIDFTVGEPLLLEVNSNAYFDAFEAVSGINVARLYAEYISKKIGA